MLTTAFLHTVLPGAAIGAAPDWIMLVPAGTFRGEDGRGPYVMADPARVIAASMTGDHPRLPIDENHATDHAMRTGQPSPARGWIVQMDVRDGALWGRVEWTASGQVLMAEGAYRGISPVFSADKAGRIHQVFRAALTNTPNLGDLPTLHTRKDDTMDLAQIRAALALPETADEAAVMAALAAQRTATAAHSAELARIATAAGVAAGADLVTVLAAQRAGAGDAGRMAAELVTLQTQVTTMRNDAARQRATAAIDGAVRAGKPIPTTLRDHYIARHMADAASVDLELAGMVSLHAGGMPIMQAASDMDGETMSKMDMETCKKMGLDPKAFAAHKKAVREAALADMEGSRA